MICLFPITTEAAIKQTIVAISFNPGILMVGETTTVNATATSFLPVTFSSTTPSVCNVNSNTVTVLTAGVCTVAANQTGDATYSPAPQKTKSITVKKKSQAIGPISFNPSMLLMGIPTTVSATATSGLSVSFRSTTPSTCAVLNGIVSGVTVGDCIVSANQAGNAVYNSSTQKTKRISVRKGNQTISAISFNPPTLAVGGTTTASATGTSNLPVSFSSITSSVCTK